MLGQKGSSDSGLPAARGRPAILRKMKSVAFGVSSPRGWAAQMEDCEMDCKRDIAAEVAACHALGKKFTDADFPPNKKSLFVNGEKPSSSSRMPRDMKWRRASELCPSAMDNGAWALEVSPHSRLIPGAIDDTAFLGVVALLRAAQRSPDDLIVHHDLSSGIVGVRLFKDGEWAYEVIDDYVPCCNDGLACGRTSVSEEVWIALIEKANAKIHGSYEAVQRSTELETFEDLTGGAVRKLDRREVASGKEFLRSLKERQIVGCLHMAARRRERRGEELPCGLLSGHGYPISEPEASSNEDISCRLENPWPTGGFRSTGSDSAPPWRQDMIGNNRPTSFQMSAADLSQHFTEVLELRIPPQDWTCHRVTLSTDRPSYPLLSSRTYTQCCLIACQPDRRWNRQDSYLNGLGVRVYRCRVQAAPQGLQGARQDPKANPFEPLELIKKRPLGKTRSACVEFVMEPYSLYLVAVDSQYRCPCCVLRFACNSSVQFREMSAPEAGHFISAQTSASVASEQGPSLSRQYSDVTAYSDSYEETTCGAHELLTRRCSGAPSLFGGGSSWWGFGCN